ncbi:acyl-CoA dehydrogenase [candidate division WOR_3 bacterium SM1_77]|jgi:butyryl-CoA dehydrogenase|uniref:Acyl-CoA dehydrogenase n=1 Tax=candidate division WOR_3 bacterium SM1_77 TaxID=1703778 RepID=A0A0S8K174_UNCW3|nr:MAG: acyl-CoA dehydrogenase [candidate division WOR_3 bacterium SM1_77]
MNFDLTNDQKMLQDQVRKFAQAELAPMAPEIDKSGDFPWPNLKKMAQLGLLGVIVPEQYGGSGFDFVSLAIAIEEISRVCASTGVIVAVNNTLTTYPILQFGNEEQKKKYLPPLCSGEKIGAFGITEPNAGSDVVAIESTARLEGDHYVLNGTKRFITNGGEAGIFVVFAYTNKELKHKGISAFVVERDTPGFSLGKHEDLMGIRATANCELIFEDAKIPKENLLGKEGDGFKICMNTLDVSRIDIGAQAVGIAQAALDEAVKYSKERKAFGQPICNFQMIQSMFAEMATEIQAARLLVFYAGYCKDKGMQRFSKESAMAKYYAANMAVDVARKSVQIHGGYGYTKDYVIERLYRDAKILELYEGTSEIQKIVIARELTR